MTPMEAILSATALGGEIMLQPDEPGKVRPGYYARAPASRQMIL
jgi:imidazolonepropionase-like amidohydrolase